MEGIFFYWIMWMGWIITTFFMKKGTLRFSLSIFILLTLILSEYYMVTAGSYLRVSLVLFLAFGYYISVIKNQYRSFSFYIIVLTLMFAYSGIMLFRIYDPVWFLFDYRLLVGVAVSILAIYLCRQSAKRYAIYIISVSQGEIVYWFVLNNFHKGLTIGTSGYLDIVVIGCTIIYLWNVTQNILLQLEQMIQKPAKEKQG